MWCYHATCCPLPSLGLTPGCPCSHHRLSPALTTVSVFLSFSPPDLSTGSGGQQGLHLVSSSLRIQHSFVWYGTVSRFDLREHKPRLGPMNHPPQEAGPTSFPMGDYSLDNSSFTLPVRLPLTAVLVPRWHECHRKQKQSRAIDIFPFRSQKAPSLPHKEAPSLATMILQQLFVT